jgi:hypothetical protein
MGTEEDDMNQTTPQSLGARLTFSVSVAPSCCPAGTTTPR